MKLFSKLCALSVLACAAVPFGCSTETKPPTNAPDGAPSKLTCGSTACEPIKGIGIEKITQCCTDSDECGYQLPGAIKCLPPDAPGNTSSACGNYTVPDVPTLVLTGCCGAQGCGKLDPFLGCIVNTDLGLPAQSCTYDPTNDCSYIESVGCDGSEDCPTGQRCCSALGVNHVSRTGCYDSCSTLITTEEAANWRELCHTNADCEDSTYECRTSQALPSWLFRCFSGLGNPAATNLDTTAGHVNCGANSVCASGQKCCLSQSTSTGLTGYCADQNAECKCHPPDGGP